MDDCGGIRGFDANASSESPWLPTHRESDPVGRVLDDGEVIVLWRMLRSLGQRRVPTLSQQDEGFQLRRGQSQLKAHRFGAILERQFYREVFPIAGSRDDVLDFDGNWSKFGPTNRGKSGSDVLRINGKLKRRGFLRHRPYFDRRFHD